MKKRTISQEFKAFIARGNMVDFAIAALMSSSFTKLIESIIHNLLSPFLVVLSDESKIDRLSLNINGIIVNYGPVLKATINFCAMFFVVFFIVKTMNALQEKITGEPIVIKEEQTEVQVLKAIKKDLKKKVHSIEVKPGERYAEEKHYRATGKQKRSAEEESR